jgi:hypothetical protein
MAILKERLRCIPITTSLSVYRGNQEIACSAHDSCPSKPRILTLVIHHKPAALFVAEIECRHGGNFDASWQLSHYEVLAFSLAVRSSRLVVRAQGSLRKVWSVSNDHTTTYHYKRDQVISWIGSRAAGAGCYLIQPRFICTEGDVCARSGGQPSR